MEVGALEIGAKINTREIDRGTDRIKQDLSQVKESANSATADIQRMDKSTSKLGNALLTAGTIGSGIMVGLASKAPAVAGAMARIKVETGELSRNLGTALKPAFEFAASGMSKLNDMIAADPEGFTKIATGIGLIGIAAAGVKIATLTGIGTAVTTLGTMLVAGLSPAALGILATLAGAAGASIAITITDFLGITSNKAGAGEGIKRFGVSVVGGALAGAGTGAAIGALGGPIGSGLGAVIGAIGGLLYAGINEYRINRKEQEQNTEYFV